MKTGEIPMSDRIYLDTSAYFEDLCNHPRAKAIRGEISGKIICSGVILFIEAERNLVRLSRQGQLSLSDYETTINRLRSDSHFFEIKSLTIDICLSGIYPTISTPRSGDLVHLRTALWFKENGGLDAFLTLDVAQKRSAKDFGLPVVEV